MKPVLLICKVWFDQGLGIGGKKKKKKKKKTEKNKNKNKNLLTYPTHLKDYLILFNLRISNKQI